MSDADDTLTTEQRLTIAIEALRHIGFSTQRAWCGHRARQALKEMGERTSSGRGVGQARMGQGGGSMSNTAEALARIEASEGPVSFSTNDVGAVVAEAADGNFWGAGKNRDEAIRSLTLAVFGCPVCGQDVYGDKQGWFHSFDLTPICEGVPS